MFVVFVSCTADAYKPCLRGKGTFDSECPEQYRDSLHEQNGYIGGLTHKNRVSSLL